MGKTCRLLTLPHDHPDQIPALLINGALGFKSGAALVVARGFDRFDLFLGGELVFQVDGGGAAGFFDHTLHSSELQRPEPSDGSDPSPNR